MRLKKVGIKEMDAELWGRVQLAVIRRRFQGDPNMTTAKWLSGPIRAKLRKENG